MHALLQDIQYFGRTIRHSPGFFAVAALTLALGIGANTAIFSVINAVLLRPLPFREPDALVRLFETEASPGNYPFAGPDYIDWQAQNKTLEAMALFGGRRFNVSGGAEPVTARAATTEANFFAVLGVPPLLGRTFARGEDRLGGSRVAVLSYGFWQRHLGGDRSVLDKPLLLDSERYTVIGVMPSWFNYPIDVELWTPLDMSPQGLGSRGNHNNMAIGRLKPGVSVSQAQADLAVIAARLEKQYPDSNAKVGAAVVSMKDWTIRNSREPLLVLLGAVALVLLVACANVANLLLIRSGGRRRELAIRAAIGAGRWRVFRQLLTESVLLAFVGGAAGLAAAWWGIRLLQSVKSMPVPLVNPIRIDVPVLLFTAAAAVVTGVLFGVLPALQASSVPLSDELNSTSHGSGGTGARTRRLRDVIAVAEIAVSLALLVGAGLLVRSFDEMRHAEIGVDSRSILTMGINLPRSTYATADAQRAFFDRLIERVRSTPGIRAASFSRQIPLEGGSNGYITVAGEDNARLANQLFEWNYVTPEYFRTFGIPLLLGRYFTAEDEARSAEVARTIDKVFSVPNPPPEALKGLFWPGIVNRTMARLVWGTQDPVGRTFLLGGAVTVRVIGVVADSKVRGVRGEALPQASFAFAGSLGGRGSGTRYLSVKTDGAPESALAPIRAHLAALDPALAVANPRSMDDVMSDGMQDMTLVTWLLGAFAAVAAALAAVGLYSVMAFLVAQRRREIGIRIALGAGHHELLRLVLGHAAKLIVIGLIAGLGAALWLTRLLQGLLFGVAANDLPTFAVVSCLLAVVALAACAIPVRRAMGLNPVVALRCE
jgi:putative ABC transport system permease protein